MKCPSCSAEIPAGARFCPLCASPLSDSEAGSDPSRDAATELAPEGSSAPPSATSQLSSAATLDGSRFLPGTLVDGRYRVVGVLGKGGMGEVYRADDLKLGQPVALKFLPASMERNSEWLDRFLTEVKIARQISNPNVCRVYDVGEVDGHHYLSMEYIDGEDLGSLLRRIGRLPQAKAVQIARQLCAGLAAAHDQGVLHRDLKPANVMIDGRGNARLTDFGLAGLAKAISAEDIRSGTPQYMAPEQLEGREVTVRSDLYALGLVLYQLFTGEKAFEADSMAELSRLHKESAPTSPSSLVEALDPTVERVILRCLAKEPSERPRTALEVSAALPGGDPLAAALAAGETPSPEMVAAAGEEGSLPPKTALGLLLGFLVLTSIFVALAGRYQVTAQLPLDLPPEVLIHKSQELLESFGVDGADVGDSAWGFSYDSDLQRYLQTELKGRSEPWDAVGAGRPALLRFWYRQSPRSLMALRNFPSSVSWGEPPYESSGMASVRIDTKGRLVEFVRVPQQLEGEAGAGSELASSEPDWAAVFDAAQLDMTRFEPATPAWVPPTYADRRAAWTGPLDGLEDTQLRVEAAAYRGQLVYVELIGPWSRASRQVSAERTARNRVNQILGISIFLLAIFGGAWVARRNLRAGRGDARGALRVALALLAVSLISWVLLSHHVGRMTEEIVLFIFSLGVPLFISVLAWMLYVALEPYMRSNRPHWLVSWTRLLSGRVRDPLVGRDVLIGAALGATLAALGAIAAELGFLLEPDVTIPSNSSLQPLRGFAPAVGWLVSSIQGAVLIVMLFIFVWFVLRFTLRSGRIAAVLVIAILTVTSSSSPGGFSWVGLVAAAAISVLVVLVTARFGLLVLITGSVFGSGVSNLPIHPNPSVWWAQGSWLCLLLLAAVAIWAFRTALGGRAILAEP